VSISARLQVYEPGEHTLHVHNCMGLLASPGIPLCSVAV
jgi:hypothetical protein